jgi:hypothetical protein
MDAVVEFNAQNLGRESIHRLYLFSILISMFFSSLLFAATNASKSNMTQHKKNTFDKKGFFCVGHWATLMK